MYPITGQAFGLLVRLQAMAIDRFSNWWESPPGAFPSYALLGATLAPLLGAELTRR